jgi:hypothetical protein
MTDEQLKSMTVEDFCRMAELLGMVVLFKMVPKCDKCETEKKDGEHNENR